MNATLPCFSCSIFHIVHTGATECRTCCSPICQPLLFFLLGRWCRRGTLHTKQQVLLLSLCIQLETMSFLISALRMTASTHLYTCRLVWSCSGVVRKQFTTAQNILKVHACCCSNTARPRTLTLTAKSLKRIQKWLHIMQLHCSTTPHGTPSATDMDCRLHGCTLPKQAHTLYCACFSQLC